MAFNGALRRSGTKLKSTVIAVMTLVGALLSAYPLAAWAQALPEEELEQKGLAPQAPPGNWDITLGAGIAAVPTYPGAKDYHARLVPLASITYRNTFFLGPSGLGMNAINWNGFRAGPVLGYLGGRNQSDDPHLNGLGDIQPSLTAGMFASYRMGPFEVGGTVRQAVVHTNNGLVGRVQLDYRRPIIANKLEFDVGPEIDLGDSQYERTWFGVSPGQSARSGLPAFTPGGGVTDAGAHLMFNYRYSEHILFRAFGDVREFVGDASNSPIVQSKTQAIIGIGIAYHWGAGDANALRTGGAD
ncbi:MAG TPA: MipA/OmpV family protein [Xanthobacteraceae bacterium]|nr:MipA/OmpV family protein [Xanthobacteraceae bacterium]